MNLQWYDWVGILGTLMVLGAFLLLQAGRMSGTSLVYQLLNLFGATGVLVSLLGRFNLAVFLLEGAWVAISVYGIYRSMKARAAARAARTSKSPAAPVPPAVRPVSPARS